MRIVNVFLALLLTSCAATKTTSPYPHQWHGEAPSYIGRDGLDSQVIPTGAVAQLVLNAETLEGWQMAPRAKTGPNLIVVKHEESSCLGFVERKMRVDETPTMLARQVQDELKSSDIQVTDIHIDQVTGRAQFACRNLAQGMVCFAAAAVQADVKEYGLAVTVMCPVYGDVSEDFATELMNRARLVYRVD